MNPSRNYWVNLFTGTTWEEFVSNGAAVTGFRSGRTKTASLIRPGDCLLCYLTGLSRWIGVLEAVSSAYVDESPIWKSEVFPIRVKVRVIAALTPETAVPIHNLRDRLTIFDSQLGSKAWTAYVRRGPYQWRAEDGEAVVQAILAAVNNPVHLPVDKAKLHRSPTSTQR